MANRPLRGVCAAIALAVAVGFSSVGFAFAQDSDAGRAVSDRQDSGRQDSGRQDSDRQGEAREPAAPPRQPRPLPAASTTRHTLELPGRKLAFTAIAGALRTDDAQGVAQLDIGVISYTLDGGDARTRPVTFVFNGGPGAASAFLQLGVAGPWRTPLDGAALAPSAPVAVQPNAETWLDFTDLVFIDPVGTGFSRFVATSEDLRKRTWSVNGDIDLLAATIRRWLVVNGRIASPKYVLGESYGGFRGPRVVRALQTGQGIGVDGMILVSPVLDFGLRSGLADPFVWVDLLPSMTAASRESKGAITRDALADVEAYARGDYLRDLAAGIRDKDAISRIDDKVAAFTGLDPALVRERAGRIDAPTYLRESHRDTGQVGSFYEANELSPDPYPNSQFSNHPDLVLDGLRGPLTSAMLDIYGRELKWLPDAQYELLNVSVEHGWDFGRGARPESISAMRAALALDRRLKVLIAHGMTDLVTPYFGTQLLLDQIPQSIAGDRVRLMVLPGGHMFYMRDASRLAFRDAAMKLYQSE